MNTSKPLCFYSYALHYALIMNSGIEMLCLSARTSQGLNTDCDQPVLAWYIEIISIKLRVRWDMQEHMHCSLRVFTHTKHPNHFQSTGNDIRNPFFFFFYDSLGVGLIFIHKELDCKKWGFCMGWEFVILKHHQQGFAFFGVSMAPLASAGTCTPSGSKNHVPLLTAVLTKLHFFFFLQVTFKSQILVDILPLTDEVKWHVKAILESTIGAQFSTKNVKHFMHFGHLFTWQWRFGSLKM